MPQDQLKRVLDPLVLVARNQDSLQQDPEAAEAALQLQRDASVVRVKVGESDALLVSSTDFFYPLVEDPWEQGWIGAANVLSDLYAMGIVEISTVLMILGASRDMNPTTREIVTREFVAGFNAACRAAGTYVTGGQTVLNPWPIIGGTAMAVVSPDKLLDGTRAQPGDVLVLTKPLGMQLIVNALEWLSTRQGKPELEELLAICPEPRVRHAFRSAVRAMRQLNRSAASLLHKYGARACTDVTGFGLIGHAQQLVQQQKEAVSFVFHTLPIIAPFAELARGPMQRYRLLEGRAAETSGGLLIALPPENVENS